MPFDRISAALEAILLVATEPVVPELLARIVETSVDDVVERCTALAEEYRADGRGFVLARVAGGYRLQTAEDQVDYVERFLMDPQRSRLSAAALETLAIIAYKQPVSRNQIAAVRGVNVDGVMRTLQKGGYITEVARDPGPGRAVLYGTTVEFLERLGLDSLDELPPLGDFVPGVDVVEMLERGLRVVDEPAPHGGVDESAPHGGVDEPAASRMPPRGER